MKPSITLAASVTWITASVISGAMFVYAVIQLLSMPGDAAWRILLSHTWHVLVLGGLSYVALRFLLQKKVVEPVRELNLKLYGIARGDNTPIGLDSSISEVQDITESVNLMLTQFCRTSHDPWVGRLRDGSRALKALSGNVPGSLSNADRELLVRTAAEMAELATMLERFEARAQSLDHEML